VNKKHLNNFLRYAVLIIVSVLFLYPFAWLLSTSLKANTQIFIFPPVWIPNPVRFSNYVDAFTTIPYMSYLVNSCVVVIFALLGEVLSAPVVGYAFSKLRWKGRDKVFLLVLATMMLPFQVVMIPLYSMYAKLGLINTYLPLVLPDFFGKAYFVFLMRQFFLTIPEDISDSGRIDGASEFRIFTSLVLPLARPALVSVILFTFVWSWTDFLGPLIFLTDSSRWTISIGLSQFTVNHGMNWALLMAGSTIFMIPMVILFCLLQRTFIEGITVTGMKE
jgi:multiple sugar transport system permease protein